MVPFATLCSLFPAFPEHIPVRFAVAGNAKDPDGIGALFAEDADFVNVVGLWWRCRQHSWKAHAMGLQTFFRDSILTIEQTEVTYVTDAVATVHHDRRGWPRAGGRLHDLRRRVSSRRVSSQCP
ncbi:MAG: SgcJ/EcaC family oxidoreductase [Bacteroidetes bacterium]|nr:SgcJ/EcaC family oxidoreductase [Bacteroidota bacterium]